MTATQQQKRMTLGRATRSVAMRICSRQTGAKMKVGGPCTTCTWGHYMAGLGWVGMKGPAPVASCPGVVTGMSGVGRYGKGLMTGHLQWLVIAFLCMNVFRGWELGSRGLASTWEAYIVLMEEGQVADDADPDKQR